MNVSADFRPTGVRPPDAILPRGYLRSPETFPSGYFVRRPLQHRPSSSANNRQRGETWFSLKLVEKCKIVAVCSPIIRFNKCHQDTRECYRSIPRDLSALFAFTTRRSIECPVADGDNEY